MLDKEIYFKVQTSLPKMQASQQVHIPWISYISDQDYTLILLLLNSALRFISAVRLPFPYLTHTLNTALKAT